MELSIVYFIKTALMANTAPTACDFQPLIHIYYTSIFGVLVLNLLVPQPKWVRRS